MKFLKENWFKISLLIIGLIISTILYQALVIVPNQKIESEEKNNLLLQQKDIQKQNMLDACFLEAENKKIDSIKYWNNFKEKTCIEGEVGGGSQMSRCLDIVLTEDKKAEKQEKDNREECIKIYQR